jgi:hypothetical protein
MAFIIALAISVITVELWLPIAGLFGVIKLIVTFSISQGWEAFKSVPMWVWDTSYSLIG